MSYLTVRDMESACALKVRGRDKKEASDERVRSLGVSETQKDRTLIDRIFFTIVSLFETLLRA